ncbi:MAG: hypothetical protein M3072_07420 [Candidatus Dormibacteraeota bacterium]|nr:hypothetical protein [Candidatus Dormibacteraeota bacterium]
MSSVDRRPSGATSPFFETATFGSVPKRAAAALEVLWAKSEHMSMLIELMLEISRLEDQQLDLEVADHDLRELVGAAIETMRPFARR